MTLLYTTDEDIKDKVYNILRGDEVFFEGVLLGRQTRFSIQFPATWGIHKVASYVEELLTSLPRVTISRRIGFPKSTPSRSPWFDRDVVEEVPDFVAWSYLAQFLYETNKEDEQEIIYFSFDDDDDDGTLYTRGFQ